MITFNVLGTTERLRFRPRCVILGGFTGRNQKAVQRHIEELRRQGIAAPPRVPILYPVFPELLTTKGEITVLDENTSGEAEYVLLVHRGEVYVGVGSDHTDRELEKHDIIRSKQLCPKVVSRQLWPLRQVQEQWDDLLLQSWAGESGQEEFYQVGKLAAIIAPQGLLDLVRQESGDDLEGCVIFSGTLPTIGGQLSFAPSFRAELSDPTTGNLLSCRYRVRLLTGSCSET